MNSTEALSSNLPFKLDYALYINGVYVPAAGIGISQNTEEINVSIYLAPAKEIRLLGYNDRLHFAFFIRDPNTKKLVLFTEGEITGYSEQITSSSAFVYLSGRSFKKSLNIPVASIVGDPSSLKNVLNPAVAQIIAPAGMVMLMGLSGVYAGTNQESTGKDNPLVPSDFLTQITTPFDYVQSMFSIISGAGAILNGKISNEEQVSSFKKMCGSYIYRFANRYIYSKNLIKKIIPDVSLTAKIMSSKDRLAAANAPQEAPKSVQQTAYEQFLQEKNMCEVPSESSTNTPYEPYNETANVCQEPTKSNFKMFYESYVRAMQVMSAITQRVSPNTSGSLIDVVDSIVSLFEVTSIPMLLPPLVKLSRVFGPSYTNPGKLIYDTNGSPYIGNIIYKNNNIFTVIPRSNYITSSVIESMNFNFSYVGRVTRVYSYFNVSDAATGNELLSLTAAYPSSIIDNVYLSKKSALENSSLDPANLDLSLLVSREEAFRGVNRVIIPPHPLHMYAVTVSKSKDNAEGAKKFETMADEYLKEEKEVVEGEEGKEGGEEKKSENELILLNRYVLYNYVFMRSTEGACSITMPFNPYLIVGYPVIFVDKKTGNSFIGLLNSVSHSITANAATTSISISNIMFLEEYLSKIAEAVEEEHSLFRAPSPYYIPNVDWLTQTYEGGKIYFGQTFYRGIDDNCIIILEDIFEFWGEGPISFEINKATGKCLFTEKLFRKMGEDKKNYIKNYINYLKYGGLGNVEETDKQSSYGPLMLNDVKDIMNMQANLLNEKLNKEFKTQVVVADFSMEISVKDTAPGFSTYMDYLSFIFRPGVSIDEYIDIHRRCGTAAENSTFIEGDKPLMILDFKCDPTDNVNSSEYSLTYADVTGALLSYTNKILSQTPENFYSED
ncbi:MAG: hypothetical protein QXQ43_00600 [Nitrososphaerota archaeon]